MDNSRDLQALLNAFSAPTILLGLDYRILIANDAYRRLYGFSDQPVRHKCYEVSHNYSMPCDLAGESCPLKESLATGENTRVLHVHHTPRGEEYVNVEMWPVKDPQTQEVLYFVEHMHPSTAGSTDAHSIGLVGRSREFQTMLGLVERVAPSNATVLLLGESGTGKELVAQAIHRLSPRADASFVPVECTGLPESLFESELFGYKKGAFTGAAQEREGLVRMAESGTLFLDEIGDIPLAEQVKLLRLLESRRYRKVGGTHWVNADFRLVCATNKNLSELVARGQFREDLYYRLNVFEILLPPLRDRIDDVELLTKTILERLGSEVVFDEEAQACLKLYSFPGNVRELRNIVERATLLADDGVVHKQHLPASCQQEGLSGAKDSTFLTFDEVEKQYLRSVLAQHQGDRKKLAELLGVSERVLYRKIAGLR